MDVCQDLEKRGVMSAETIIFMVVVLGIIWGGFVYTLKVASRKEAEKRIRGE